MKKFKNQNFCLGALALLGGAVGILAKDRTIKAIGFGTSALAGGFLLAKMYKEEAKKIEQQCQETEEAFDNSGLNPQKIETTTLLSGTEEETPVFAGLILKEIRNSSVLPDEFLEYNYGEQLNTLHVMQNVEKSRLIISIPLPPRAKGNLGAQEIREYYKQLFEEFIDEHQLDMKAYLNQIGVVVTLGDEEPPYTYYEEILRDEDESFPDYLKRVISYQKESQLGKTPRGLNLNDGEKFVRVEQYLNLEFPVFPVYSRKKGLDILTAVKLIKTLTEPAYIKSEILGRSVAFDLNHVAFHPTDDYGTILVMKGGEIKDIGI